MQGNLEKAKNNFIMIGLDHGSDKLWPQEQIQAIVINKVVPIYLHIGCDCFHTTVAKLNSCEKDRWPARPKIFYYLAFYQKCSLTPGLDQSWPLAWGWPHGHFGAKWAFVKQGRGRKSDIRKEPKVYVRPRGPTNHIQDHKSITHLGFLF